MHPLLPLYLFQLILKHIRLQCILFSIRLLIYFNEVFTPIAMIYGACGRGDYKWPDATRSDPINNVPYYSSQSTMEADAWVWL